MVLPVIQSTLQALVERSQNSRNAYLELCRETEARIPSRGLVSKTNLAHSYAAATDREKSFLRQTQNSPNIAIVTAYNDMLSAHQPYYRYPEKLKEYALKYGATAQVAGGTPAMCDGVTQGQPGMELSLFSRDVIALSTAVALSHNTFDGCVYLGICDKIVPGLLIGALSFGHLPGIFIPSGPMHSGISNEEKASVRVAYAEGKVGDSELLESEEKSYHSQGTCTFYGTANSNQMLLEMMGLQLPGSAFVHPVGRLRDMLTEDAMHECVKSCLHEESGLGFILEAENLLNGVIGLLATGGSTNHTMHLVAIARAAGWDLQWQDIAALSEVIPLVCKLYPNGSADVNAFHDNGGTPAVIDTLSNNGMLFTDIKTCYKAPFQQAACFPHSVLNEQIDWIPVSQIKKNADVFRPADAPFLATGGLKLLKGNLGKAIIKVSSLGNKSQTRITAPAVVFRSQQDIIEQFREGKLNRDFIAVLPGQGPAAIGMPELHKLTPPLTSLQNNGYQVALITDGRMSGASGKFPAAIHLTPEAVQGGLIGKVKSGDMITLDWQSNTMELQVSESEIEKRETFQLSHNSQTLGRVLFRNARSSVSAADLGASFII